MGANEWLDNRQQNFQAEIRSYGISIMYDFGNFIPDKYRIRPWISAGVNAFDFLSKTDLYDKNGNKSSETTKLVPDKNTILRIYYSKWDYKKDVAKDAQLDQVFVKFNLKQAGGSTLVKDEKILVRRCDVVNNINAKKIGLNTINYTFIHLN